MLSALQIIPAGSKEVKQIRNLALYVYKDCLARYYT